MRAQELVEAQGGEGRFSGYVEGWARKAVGWGKLG